MHVKKGQQEMSVAGAGNEQRTEHRRTAKDGEFITSGPRTAQRGLWPERVVAFHPANKRQGSIHSGSADVYKWHLRCRCRCDHLSDTVDVHASLQVLIVANIA